MRAKKYTSLVLAAIMSVSLGACGSDAQTESEPKGEVQTESEISTVEESAQKNVYGIGDTVKTDYFEFTLSNVGFAEKLNIDMNDKDKFFTSESGTSLSADEGKQWMYYEIDCKYVGKASIKNISPAFSPQMVQYQDYTFDNTYVTCFYDDGTWKILDDDIDATIPNMSSAKLPVEPLEEGNHIIRGAIQIPNAAVADIENVMNLVLYHIGSYSTSRVDLAITTFEIKQ